MKSRLWKVNDALESGKSAEILLYGPVASSVMWGDEITPKDLKAELDKIGPGTDLNIYINSPGGEVFAGQAIYSMLSRFKGKKTVYIDGLAASIASVIAMVGDKVVIPKNAMMMIHKPWNWVIGNADELRKAADDIDKAEETANSVYQDKTKLSHDEIAEIMRAETWLTAEEAVEKGFADEIEQKKDIAASIEGGFLMFNGQKFDLSQYKNAPKFDYLPPKQESKPDVNQDEIDLVFSYQEKIRNNKNKIGGQK